MPYLIFRVLVEAETNPADFRDLALASLAAYGLLNMPLWAGLRLRGLSQRTYLAPCVLPKPAMSGYAWPCSHVATETVALRLLSSR